MIWIILAVIAVLVGGIAWYSKGSGSGQSRVESLLKKIPEYTFSDDRSKPLTDVKLSQHEITFRSPWQEERSNRKNGQSTIYVFGTGAELAITVKKVGPVEEMKANEYLSPASKMEYEEIFRFMESKIGPKPTTLEYTVFAWSVGQDTVDKAASPEDKAGYSRILAAKNFTSPSSSSSRLSRFDNGRVKGLVNQTKTSDIPTSFDFWDKNDYTFHVAFPGRQNLFKADIDSVIRSIESHY